MILIPKTSTDLTIKHYQRQEVREAILRFSQPDRGWRVLSGDEGWYITIESGDVRLRSPEDYDNTLDLYRTLYATLDILEPSVKSITKPWNDERNAPLEPIGTLSNCLAYTLGADIDSIGNIMEDLSIVRAVEDLAKYLVSRLNDAGISRSVYCLYSGGGIYVLIHHGLSQAKPEWLPEEREQAFRSLTIAYNMWLSDIEAEFFRLNPGHQGKVRLDKINNQKRKFKCIFSIHKKYPVSVIPLDPANIKIDFQRAKVPLAEVVLTEGAKWYRDYDPAEKSALQAMLAPYAELAYEDLSRRKERSGSCEIFRKSEPVPVESWPPCMKNIMDKAEPGLGPHRACAVLAAYLFQAGWPEKESFDLWKKVADRSAVEPRIFDCWYGQMSCPNCSTIQKTCSGYPKIGLGGLGYCQPNELCNGICWPGEYGTNQSKQEEQSNREETKDEKQAKVLARLVSEEAELFKDDVDQPYARIKVGSHFEVWPIDGKRFKLWLVNRFHKVKEDIPGSDSINRALMLIESDAYFNGKEKRLELRVAEHEGSFWYDLADDRWRAVQIAEKGWEIIDNPPPIFKRYGNTAAQVMPTEKGDLRQILKFINIRDHEDQEIFLIYLVTCFIPGISHPVLPIYGEKGAAKTTTQKIVRRLVDPAKQELMTMPTRPDELALQMAQNYMPTYDNMSKLLDWQSDMLCSACTGCGISKRRLYSDTDEVILSFKRCVGLNGINLVADKPDLLDRAILFELERVSEESRKAEQEFWDDFEDARPSILSGIFDTLSQAMAIYSDIKLPRLPRMADFCRWGYAAAEATGLGGEEFLQIYNANIQAGNQEAVQNSPVASAMVAFMAGQRFWEGSMADLLKELNDTATGENIETKGWGWPKAPNVLSKKLKQVKNNLSQMGIEYSLTRDCQNRSLIRLEAGGTGRRSGDDSKRSPDNQDVDGYRFRRSGGSGDKFGTLQDRCKDEDSICHSKSSVADEVDAQQVPKCISGISGSPGSLSGDAIISGDNPEIQEAAPEVSPAYSMVRFLEDVPSFEARQFKHPQKTIIYGPFKIDDVASLPSEKAIELIASNQVEEVKDDLTRCLACQTEIGPGYGSYGGRYCAYCGPALKAVKDAARELDSRGLHVTQDSIYQHLRVKGRAPRIELISILLSFIGIVPGNCSSSLLAEESA